MTEKKHARRDVVKTGAAAATGATFLAGCGGSPEENNAQGSGEDQEPELEGVDLYLSADDKADFTQNDEYSLGLKAKLKYSDGSEETKKDLDYEVENAEVRKTSEDGKTGDEEGYGVLNGIGENLEFTEFTDEDLKKTGHYQELEDLEIQDGEIILSSDDLITGYSQIDLDINVTDQEIGEYVGTYEDQQVLEVNKPEEQALQDLQVQGPEAVELWQKFREIRADIMLDKLKFADIRDVAIEETRNELQDEENPDIQTELGHLGTEFGREVQRRFGVSPSGTTAELAHVLASTDFQTSNRNGMAGVISANGHNSNSYFVPGSNEPSDEEFWSKGKTYNVNTKREESANPPDQLSDYTRGPYGQMFNNPERHPDLAQGTFDSLMELSENITRKRHSMINADYAVSLVDGLGDDTNEWHDNLKHIMETAVGNLFSTEHDLIPTGSAEEPEVELR